MQEVHEAANKLLTELEKLDKLPTSWERMKDNLVYLIGPSATAKGPVAKSSNVMDRLLAKKYGNSFNANQEAGRLTAAEKFKAAQQHEYQPNKATEKTEVVKEVVEEDESGAVVASGTLDEGAEKPKKVTKKTAKKGLND